MGMKTRSMIVAQHLFSTEIPLKTVNELSPMAAANAANVSSTLLILTRMEPGAAGPCKILTTKKAQQSPINIGVVHALTVSPFTVANALVADGCRQSTMTKTRLRHGGYLFQRGGAGKTA
jgi:hypothetical protein